MTGTNVIDRLVGGRMRLRRTLIGLSREKLADALGVTIFDVQRYEEGRTRIGASRLHRIARLLDCPVTYFFELDRQPAALLPSQGGPPGPSVFADPEFRELALAFRRIRSPAARRALIDVAHAAARFGSRSADEPANDG